MAVSYFEKSLREQMKTRRFWATITAASFAVYVLVVLWMMWETHLVAP